jgi:hypothetical protein
MNILDRLQNIDRRILYVLIAVVIATPLLLRPARHPRVVMKEVSDAYATLDKVHRGKVVIISVVYGAGTEAENGPQTEVIMRQLLQKRVPFAILSWDPVGAKLVHDTAVQLSKEYHAKYGTDWVDLGYRPGPIYAVISGMAENFPKVIEHDSRNTKVSKIPMLKNVKNHKGIGAVVEITPSGTLGTWIAYFNMPYHIPLVFCPTAVMAAEAYPFLDSGQVNGMLNGVIGAAQYEVLLNRQNERTYAAAASWALSAAHIFIIGLIVLGNVGYVLSKRAARREQQ